MQAVGERHVARLEPGMLGRPRGCLLAAAERAERVGAGDGLGEPVHHRAVDGQRRAGDDRQGQAVGEAGGDLPGPAGHGDVDPRGGHRRAQVGDGHGGHGDPGRVQQLAGHLPGVVFGVFLVAVVGAGEQAPDRRAAGSRTGSARCPASSASTTRPTGWRSGQGSACAMRTAVMGVLREVAGMRSGRCAVMCSRNRRRALCRLALAAPGVPGDLPGGLVGVVEQGDGLALPGGQAGDRAAQRVGAVQVLSRRQAAGRGRVQVLGPVAEQRQRRPAPLGAADVGHDAAQPAGEPAGVAQPVQGDERLQERVLHGIVGVVRLRA